MELTTVHWLLTTDYWPDNCSQFVDKQSISGQPVVQPLNSNDAEVPEDDILNFFKVGQKFFVVNKFSSNYKRWGRKI